MTAEAKAKYRAAEKARHKGQVLKTEEITTSATDANAAGASKDKDNKLTYNEIPEGTKLKYDKQLLVKKPKLKRRQYHHYDTRPLRPREASRENRRLRKHSKGKGDRSRPTKDDAAPLGQPTDARPIDEPTPAPPTKAPRVKETKAPEPKVKEPKAPKVKEEKAPKEKKAKKAPVPKPDPTQERPDY
jgi:hypothetical protein